MSTPHRATPEQWAKCDEYARSWSGAFNCILELRARVEALEAPQLEQAESHRFCTDAIVRRVEALELAHCVQFGTLTPVEHAEQGVVTHTKFKAAILRSASNARQVAIDELRAASAEVRPAAREIFPVEYADANGEGIRIIMEPADETGRVCWVVRNSRRVNPIREFPTPEAAYAAHLACPEQEADRG